MLSCVYFASETGSDAIGVPIEQTALFQKAAICGKIFLGGIAFFLYLTKHVVLLTSAAIMTLARLLLSDVVRHTQHRRSGCRRSDDTSRLSWLSLIGLFDRSVLAGSCNCPRGQAFRLLEGRTMPASSLFADYAPPTCVAT